MAKFRNWKIINQLISLMMISIGAIALVQLIYYMGVQRILLDQTKVYSNNVLNQISSDLSSECRNVLKAANLIAYDPHTQTYLKSEDIGERIELYPFVNKVMGIIGSTHQGIIDISIIDLKGKVITSTYVQQGDLDVAFLYKYSYIFSLENYYKDEDFNGYLVTPYQNLKDNSGIYSIIIPVFNTDTRGAIKANEKIAACILTFSVEALKEKVKIEKFTRDTSILIVDSTQTIVMAENKTLIGDQFNPEPIKAGDGKMEEGIFLGKRKYINRVPVDGMNWSVVEIYSANENTQMLSHIRDLGFIVVVTAIILILVLEGFIIRGIRRPIQKIIDFTKRIGGNYKDKRILVIEDNELGGLGSYINKMLDEIEQMHRNIMNTQSQLYEKEIERKNAILNALQSQINPHFLYNTLECIRSIALLHDINEIVTITTSMSRIFRYSIKGGNLVQIRSEIDSMTDYLKIIDIRYGGRIVSTINIEPEVYDLMTTKMILQPIVENAIYHGLELKKGTGNLYVEGKKLENQIQFIIKDDGLGISQEKLALIQQSLGMQQNEDNTRVDSVKGLGILSIDRRIQLLAGPEYGVSIQSKEGEGTTVTIRIPITAQ